MTSSGTVYLVGAGPGEPELITVRGQALVQSADVIVYDRLVAPALLRSARADAEVIYVGKTPGEHTFSQEQINALLVDRAQRGKMVVRLKGGDPFVFGRGGEEALALVAANIRFEIVPGVTSAIAAPAYAGIPVTHRDLTSGVTIVAGQQDPQQDESGLAWQALADSRTTLVFLMGVANLPIIVRNLAMYGCAAETPVAVIERGTTDRQRVVVGTLGDIAARARAAQVEAPAVIIVGRVVALHAQLGAWFGA